MVQLVLLWAILLAPLSVYAQLFNGSITVVGAMNAGTSTTGTDDYAITLTPPLPAYLDGACYSFKADIENEAGATLNINNLGAIPIVSMQSGAATALADGDIRQGRVIKVCYDGTNFQCQNCDGNLVPLQASTQTTGIRTSDTEILSLRHHITTLSGTVDLCLQNKIDVTVGTVGATFTLPALSDDTCASTFDMMIIDTGTGSLTVSPNGADLLNGDNVPHSPLTGERSGLICNRRTTTWICWEISPASAGTLQLPINAAKPPSTNFAYPESSTTNTRLIYDNATAWCTVWEFVTPADYIGLYVLNLRYTMTSVTSGSLFFDASLMRIPPSGAAINTESYGAVTNCDDAAVPGTAGQADTITCTLSDTDGVGAGDATKLKLCRDIADTAAGQGGPYRVWLTYNRQ